MTGKKKKTKTGEKQVTTLHGYLDKKWSSPLARKVSLKLENDTFLRTFLKLYPFIRTFLKKCVFYTYAVHEMAHFSFFTEK